MTERPKLFFKYRVWKGAGECNRTREMLLRAEFYCQPPRFFDDPHDGLQGARPTGGPRDIDRFIFHNIGPDILSLMRRRGISGLTQLSDLKSPEDQKIVQQLARKNQRRETRVLSLSANPLSELMWSFYADSHRGVCLGFDAQHPFFSKARRVDYYDDPPTVLGACEDAPTEDPLLYSKGRAWEWQEEWRIVWEGEDPKLVPFLRDTLKVVIVGDWFPYYCFDDLVEALREGGYRVRIFQMERLPDSFSFQLVPIEPINPLC